MTLLSDLPDSTALTPEQQFEQDIALVMQSALDHHHKGELDDAAALYGAIIEAVPGHADANYNLAVLKTQAGQPVESVPLFETALGGQPNNGQYWVSYIAALIDSGQTPAAWIAVELAQQRGVTGPVLDALIAKMATPGVSFRTAANQVPSAAPAAPATMREEVAAKPTPSLRASEIGRMTQQEINRHVALFSRGNYPEAVKYARTLTERYPHQGEAWRALAVSLHRDGQYPQSIEPARKAVEMMPNDGDILLLLADTLRLTDQTGPAEQMIRRAIAADPDNAEAHRVLGMVLSALGHKEEAIAACERAVELAPNNANMHGTLGVTLLEQGWSHRAVEAYRRALELSPKEAVIHSNMLFSLTHEENVDIQTLFAEHRKFAARHETPFRARWPQHGNNRNPNRTLKIGIVSGDLFLHAVASYLLPVIEPLAAIPGFSLHFYSNFTREDHMTARFKGYAASWTMVTGMSDETLCRRIRNDSIDILIDLSGHTGRNRLPAFARKPAPVQASWIGYPATTGLDAMDYYLADPHAVPFGPLEEQFTERIVHLPATAPFKPEEQSPPVNILPALHNGFVTFGSFNRLNKLRPDVIALWARLMNAVPRSRIQIGSLPATGGEEALVEWFEKEGIVRDRLSFRRRTMIPSYLQQHHHVDMCLDTFPYTGSTTVLHAQWMGVPTLTIEGKTVPARAGATWMSHVGLHQFVVQDQDEFVARGTALAADLQGLAAVRTVLRERSLQSAGFRPQAIAEGLARALRVMWQRWCDGLPPAAFSVSDPHAPPSFAPSRDAQ